MLSATNRARVTSGVSPTSLALTGYWRANYSSAPWTGTASAGNSGSRNLVATFDASPTTGTALNGYIPASFDGTMSLSGGASVYAADQAFSGWVLLNPVSVAGGTILQDTSLAYNLYFVAGEGGSYVFFDLNSGAGSVHKLTVASTWQLITFRYSNGGNIEVGVNEVPGSSGGTSTTAYVDNISAPTELVVGSGVQYYDGLIAEIGLSNTVLTDTDFNNIKTYVNSRYALAL